jgi:hypothetical protein
VRSDPGAYPYRAGPAQPDTGQPDTGQPDTRFSLPAINDPASTETGVILLGLDAAQLLAGLGLAALAEDPTAVILLIDQLRHGGEARVSLGQLATLGVRRWRAEQDGHGPARAMPAASLRQAWAQTYQAVADRQPGAPATTAYLTACWLRSAEIAPYAAEIDRNAEITSLPGRR